MRMPLMAANWKMHKTTSEAFKFVDELTVALADVSAREVLICPPFTALYALGRMIRKSGAPIKLGGQNLYPAEQGAYTGEISPAMLKDANCSYVIVGHSERRQYFRESNEFVNRKARIALDHGLTPVICVGESLDQREAGQAEEVVAAQVQACLEGFSAKEVASLVIAYEPIWAIGTGRTATPGDAQAMHATIRGLVAEQHGAAAADGLRILYGGSVKPANVDSLMAKPDIDGALVGGASLQVESFGRIVKYQPA
jgi:triosephosphate isomerase